MIENNIEPTPDTPSNFLVGAFSKPSVKPATPDIILFDEENVPIDFVSQLLFEEIGGIEILSVTRNDLVNGENVSYNLIANSALIAKDYSSNNLFKVPGSIEDLFRNFSIRLVLHIPSVTSSPSLFYVGEENSFGCSGFPVLNKRDDELIGCFDTLREAETFISNQQNPAIVYVEEETGNVVVDILNIRRSDRVEIEVLSAAEVEDDTIY